MRPPILRFLTPKPLHDFGSALGHFGNAFCRMVFLTSPLCAEAAPFYGLILRFAVVCVNTKSHTLVVLFSEFAFSGSTFLQNNTILQICSANCAAKIPHGGIFLCAAFI
ncbi:hypothetical protein [uncultured Gemmiger sp.]|uniref:hypothetical protein n=1 Tax=uncultured Gemmiger sp. TaxID=1623490 RepID=UPI0025D9C529|nr:hypothetical protein [uncultured Gemmiger sp.]